MKQEATERIMSTLTPKVTMQSCYDTPDGIIAEVRHDYFYPAGKDGSKIPWAKLAKLVMVEADKEGNVYSTRGLF